MTPSLPVTGGWLRGLLAALRSLARAGSGRPWCSPYLTVNPVYAGVLRTAGLTCVEDFLALSGTIVSGHPDRQVSRVTLGSGLEACMAFLKTEHRVPWKERLLSAWAGFGAVSKSVREALTLQALPPGSAAVPEWIAVGEAADGRAFLLLRELTGVVELRRFLVGRRHAPRAWRRQFTRRLAGTLARLHASGFAHGDLYANHVLVLPEVEEIYLVDWQRCFRRRRPSLRQRWADLAALAATLAPELAGPRERLALLREYLEQSGLPGGRALLRQALDGIRAVERSLNRRRHVRAKRLPPLVSGSQSLTCLDGEALNVTAAYLALWPSSPPPWLSAAELDGEGERAVELPDGGRGLLKWRRRRPGKKGISPERAEMSILYRLQRYGIEAPQVLAVGDRRLDTGEIVSFLLTRPAADTLPLDFPPGWLGRAGALLARLHDAGCSFQVGPLGLAMQVRRGEAGRLVLTRADGLVIRRRWGGFWKRRDLRRLVHQLCGHGGGRADWLALLAGYRSGGKEVALHGS